ncbi:MAG: HAMP domain-containing histidine kinase [Alphaproteobacteria bacterium]|nr:HAMP domain-containing histidine kinase [Alphaproteobacteria bacterium]
MISRHTPGCTLRLSLKIAGLIGMCATLLVLVVAVLSMRRDLQIVEEDIARDARLVATAVAVASAGMAPDEVRALVARVGDATDGVTVEWVPEAPEGLELGTAAAVATIPVAGGGAIRVTESLEPRDRLLAGSVRTLVSTTVLVLLTSLGAGLWLGRWIVGTRVDALVRKARRVATGDFDEPAEISGGDELTTLATELNLMAGQLKRAQKVTAAAAQARVEAEIQLRHADRLRTVGQLAAGIAHELGTPLNVITGRASLLMRSLPSGGPEHTGARVVREQAERITQIVRRLMDYSRPAPARKAPTDVARLVDETLELLQSTLKGVTTGRQGPDHLEADVDPEQLRQVLTNLVFNAAQAVGGDGTVHVRLAGDADTLRIDVDDDGPGVPAELRERVLEPFFTTKEPGEGTGLGLSVVDGIVRDHGGRLEVGSSDLGGARFTVRIPLEAP